MNRTYHHAEKGFSLLELMVSTAVMLVVAGGAFGALNYYQKTYQRTEISADMHDNLRSAVDLIIQEVGQAGSLSLGTTLGNRTLTNPVFGSLAPQPVTLNDTTGIFAGEQLLVDAGAKQELVTVTPLGANSLTGVFKNAHNATAQVNAIGVFPEGIIPPTAPTNPSTATQLHLFGDLNGDGTLLYVEYSCNYVAGGAGTLTRSVTPVGAAFVNPARSHAYGSDCNKGCIDGEFSDHDQVRPGNRASQYSDGAGHGERRLGGALAAQAKLAKPYALTRRCNHGETEEGKLCEQGLREIIEKPG